MEKHRLSRKTNREGAAIDRIIEVKRQPPFRKLDIALYALLLLLIAALFWVFVLAKPTVRLKALEVWYDDRTGGSAPVFRYDYERDRYEVDPAFADRIHITQDAKGYVATFTGMGEGEGVNELAILKAGEAYIRDANCSRRKDCTHFPHILHGDQMIVCVPHRLTFVGVGPSGEIAPEDEVDIIVG